MARYALAVFVSAFLLFGVQPLAGRYALPWFGGTSGVWTACMLFFQAALLAGYAYSHLVASRLSARAQAKAHLGLLAFALAILILRALWVGSPVAPGPEWRPAAEDLPVARLVAMLAATIGLPFFVLSTTGPLLQSWFARTQPGRSPYPLYALSNAGSFLALLGYPFLVEPWVGRGAQAWGWGAGFVLFVVLCAICAVDVLKHAGTDATQAPAASTDVGEGTGRPTVGRTLGWLGLSACASVLLLATTNQLSQDVAAGPFLWVLPLAVYLVTFIVAFSRESFYSRPVYAVLLIVSCVGVVYARDAGAHFPLALQLLAYAGSLFAGCMVCHGELYRLRPEPRHLSAFYLWVSAGGVLGGLFVNLVAPFLFVMYWEYPLSLGACCLIAVAGMRHRPQDETVTLRISRIVRGALLIMVALKLGMGMSRNAERLRYAARNFFGVVEVVETDVKKPTERRFTLHHGVITHGWQYAAPDKRMNPTTYFTQNSGLGLAIAEQRRLREAVGLPPGLRVGVLGLGVGTSAALLEAPDQVRFYEINPAVISLAKGDGGFFTYLTGTPAKVDVVEGDARISLERELERGEAGAFDVLAVDTFSSDAIPVHLLTTEAVELYRKHLAPHGVLAVHISNVHLDLVPVVLAHARTSKLHATFVFYDTQGDALRSMWMVLSPDHEFSWGPTFTRSVARVRRLGLRDAPEGEWTDEKSSVLQALRRDDSRPDPKVTDVEPSSGPPLVTNPKTPE